MPSLVGQLRIVQAADDDVGVVLLGPLGHLGEGLGRLGRVGREVELGHQDHVGPAAARLVENLGELGVRVGIRPVIAPDLGDRHANLPLLAHDGRSA